MWDSDVDFDLAAFHALAPWSFAPGENLARCPAFSGSHLRDPLVGGTT